MSQIVMHATKQRVLDDGRHRTESRMQIGDTTKSAFFDATSDIPFVQGALGDIYVAQALVIAMARGLDLVLKDPISADRLDDLDLAQDILTSWYPDTMRRATITADTIDPGAAPPTARRRPWGRQQPESATSTRHTATCFTGGVDSFYTLLKNESRVDSLVYGLGIDVPLTETDQIERVKELLERVGSAVGKPVLTVETNVRRLFGQAVSWGFYGHGAALAGLGTVFSPLVERLLVPATHSYATQIPWGSHPLLDRHWSTNRLAIVHDGAEASRCDKIRAIADSPIVHDNLRVCYSEFADLNCGRCMKCLRTMTSLLLLDRLDAFSTFARPLDLELFSTLEPRTANDGAQLDDLARLADTVDGHDAARRTIATLRERHRTHFAGPQASLPPVR